VNTRPNVTKLAKIPCPRTTAELETSILVSGCIDESRTFERLANAIQQTESFLEKTLPFLWHEMLLSPKNLPDIPVLDQPGTVTLTQHQCLGILANAFFCTYHDRISNNCVCEENVPSINLDELYGGRGWGTVEVAKLRMLFNFFEQYRERIKSGDLLSRPVHFVRRRAECAAMVHWRECRTPLIMPVVHPLGESIDKARGMLQVDFANRIIGGAAIAYGAVQEEIMFCVCPELIASRLFCPAMNPDEALIFIGAEQFSRPTGYASHLEYGGPYIDQTPTREDGALDAYIAAIDAINFRSIHPRQQYGSEMVFRELVKAWAGFDAPETPATVATGNWGCGAFGGDAELKSVLQWLAASRAGKVMHYFPWDNHKVSVGFPELATILTQRNVTVGAMANFLFDDVQPGLIYRQLHEFFMR
jgi:poly(ADP-ribose) glycohydrolase